MIDSSTGGAPVVARPRPTAPAAPGRPALLGWLPAVIERSPARALASPMAIAGLFTAAMAVVTVLQVRDYYETHVPHYDSVGAYLYAFWVMNTAQSQGLLAGIALAAQNSLTWLEPFYGLLLSWIPRRSPAILVTLNFVLMALTQLAIDDWCRLNGYSRRHRVLILVLPYLPGAFYSWDGGLPDWRRDAQLNILLIGDLFLSLAYVQRPTARRGVALGALVGLTQLARDNALSMVALVVFPAVVLALTSAFRTRDWRGLLAIAWRPILVFALVVLPYYVLTVRQTIFRYTYFVWGHGEDRLASLARFWTSPADVLLGGTTAFNGQAAVGALTRQILLVGLAVLAICLLAGIVRVSLRGIARRRSRILFGAGLFVIVAVIFYNTLGLGYGAQYHGVPFFPVLVGLTAIFAALTDLIRAGGSCCRLALGRLVIAVALAGFVGANALRLQAGQFDGVGNESVRAAQRAAVEIGRLANERAVAVFWFDYFGHPHLNYFLTQAGYAPVLNTEKIDGPIRTGETPEQWLERMHALTIERAGVIVVNEELDRYANPGAEPGLFRDGRGFIQRLLDDPRLPVVYRFSVGPYRFAVLENTTRDRS